MVRDGAVKKYSIFGDKFFRLTLLFFILIEELSLFGYFKPAINYLIFVLISLLTVFFTLKKLEYGLYFILGEIFIGSKGYLFYLDFPHISIRLALFIIVFSVWLLRIFQHKISLGKILKSEFSFIYFLLFLFLFWGLVCGGISKNLFSNIFFDGNGWLFFLLVFVFLSVIKNWRQITRIIQIGFAAMIVIFLKTTFLFVLFARGPIFIKTIFYRWLRITGVGEVTQITSQASRIFIQSQVYCLIFFFIILAFWLFEKPKYRQKKWRLYYPLIFVTTFPVLVSFSRSFWLGLIVGVSFFFIVLKIGKFLTWPQFSLVLVKLFLIFFVELIIVFLLVTPSQGIDIAKNRFQGGEPAVSNRIVELKPLFKKIARHPLIGSGFGTTVTYKPRDPRTIEKYGHSYTTYAFEWGYLDIWLKIGLVGLAVYLYLIFKILKSGCQLFQRLIDDKTVLIFGMTAGLTALITINITSPYLNHPLGIAYIILCTAVLFVYSKKRLRVSAYKNKSFCSLIKICCGFVQPAKSKKSRINFNGSTRAFLIAPIVKAQTGRKCIFGEHKRCFRKA